MSGLNNRMCSQKACPFKKTHKLPVSRWGLTLISLRPDLWWYEFSVSAISTLHYFPFSRDPLFWRPAAPDLQILIIWSNYCPLSPQFYNFLLLAPHFGKKNLKDLINNLPQFKLADSGIFVIDSWSYVNLLKHHTIFDTCIEYCPILLFKMTLDIFPISILKGD